MSSVIAKIDQFRKERKRGIYLYRILRSVDNATRITQLEEAPSVCSNRYRLEFARIADSDQPAYSRSLIRV